MFPPKNSISGKPAARKVKLPPNWHSTQASNWISCGNMSCSLDGSKGPPGIRLLTQKPLAIYVPSKKLHLWQTGRSESKIAAKLAQHPGIELDILRPVC